MTTLILLKQPYLIWSPTAPGGRPRPFIRLSFPVQTRRRVRRASVSDALKVKGRLGRDPPGAAA